MIENFFPEKTIKLHHDDIFFITPKIKELMRKRNKAYKRRMTAPFKLLRNQIAAEICNEKAKFTMNRFFELMIVNWEHGGINSINSSEKRRSLQLF